MTSPQFCVPDDRLSHEGKADMVNVALSAAGGLIVTGPTRTNVNDYRVLLLAT